MAIEINPTRSTSTDPELFVNRADDVAELKLLLRGMLKDNDPDEPTGVLVKGDSGVGKSIFSKNVVRDLKIELSNRLVVLEVDGGNLNGIRGLLKRLSRVTLEEISRLNEPGLLLQAKMLHEIADYGKITSGLIKQLTSGKTIGSEIGASIMGWISSKLTGSDTWSESNSRNEGFEIPVNDDYLSELLNKLMQQMQQAGFQVLIFLDNLDRIVKSDSKDEADTLAAFIKELMTFSSCVLLLNLRTQFAHHTIDRRGLQTMVLEGLSKQALLEILSIRLAAYELSEEDKKALDAVGFRTLAEQLAELTDNALAFLRWLEFWLTRTTNQPENLAQDFKKYIRNNYQGIPQKAFKQAVEILRKARFEGIEYESLNALPLEQVPQLERAAAIEPDDLMTEPINRRYRLAHSLDFLLDPSDRFADALK